MIKDAEQRDTFLSVEEVLKHRAQRCLAAEGALRTLAESQRDRLSMACEKIAVRERRLVGLVNAFASDAPPQLLATRLQYVPEKVERTAPDSAPAAAAQLVQVNHELTQTLAALAGRMPTPELEEDLGELHRAVESLARRVSMISLTAQDP